MVEYISMHITNTITDTIYHGNTSFTTEGIGIRLSGVHELMMVLQSLGYQ